MQLPYPAALAALAAVAALPVSADNAEPPVTFEPIVTTATRTAVRDPVAPTIVITREQIARSQAIDVAELLRLQTGIEIARSGGPGQQTSIFTRGTESDHTLVLVDGVRINPSIGTAAIQNINPDHVERIEIVKGPRTSLFGSDAIGGVINIITQTPTDDLRIEVDAEGGGLGSRGGGMAISGGHFRLAAEHFETDGHPVVRGATRDRGFDNTSVSASSDHTLAGVRLRANALHAQGTTQYFAFGPSAVSQDFRNDAVSLSAAFKPSRTWTSELTLGYARDDLEQNDNDDRADTRRHSIDWQNDIDLPAGHTLTAGASWRRDDVDAFTGFGMPPAYGEQRNIAAVFLQDQWQAGGHRLVAAARHTDDERFGHHTTWNADYGHDFDFGTRLSVSAGTGFRAPSTVDLFFPGFSNPDLDAETSRNLEIGLRHRVSQQVQLGLAAFRNDIDDLIASDASFTPQNIQQARIEGLELDVQAVLAAWSARIGYVVQDADNLSADQALLRRSPRRLTAQLAYDGTRWGAGLDVVGASRRPDIDPDTFARISAPGYAVVNLTSRWTPCPPLTLSLRLENVLDKDYETAAGFPAQPRTLLARLRYRFDLSR